MLRTWTQPFFHRSLHETSRLGNVLVDKLKLFHSCEWESRNYTVHRIRYSSGRVQRKLELATSDIHDVLLLMNNDRCLIQSQGYWQPWLHSVISTFDGEFHLAIFLEITNKHQLKLLCTVYWNMSLNLDWKRTTHTY